jgi:hypothetical protein
MARWLIGAGSVTVTAWLPGIALAADGLVKPERAGG